jgi:hypothetical protein
MRQNCPCIVAACRQTAAIFRKTEGCGSLPRSRYAVGAAYSGEMIFRRCRSYGAFRNWGNFLQRFRSWRSLNTRNLPQRRGGAAQGNQTPAAGNLKINSFLWLKHSKLRNADARHLWCNDQNNTDPFFSSFHSILGHQLL